MTADRDDAACTGAVVRKPPMKETAGRVARWHVTILQFALTDPPLTLLRYDWAADGRSAGQCTCEAAEKLNKASPRDH
jgi:hypothetical protein